MSYLFFPEGGRFSFYPATVPFMCRHMIRSEGGLIRDEEEGFVIKNVSTQVKPSWFSIIFYSTSSRLVDFVFWL
jgi:hypothetical protein